MRQRRRRRHEAVSADATAVASRFRRGRRRPPFKLICTAYTLWPLRQLEVKDASAVEVKDASAASEYYSPLSPAGILARGRDAPSLDGIAICRPPALVYMCIYA